MRFKFYSLFLWNFCRLLTRVLCSNSTNSSSTTWCSACRAHHTWCSRGRRWPLACKLQVPNQPRIWSRRPATTRWRRSIRASAASAWRRGWPGRRCRSSTRTRTSSATSPSASQLTAFSTTRSLPARRRRSAGIAAWKGRTRPSPLPAGHPWWWKSQRSPDCEYDGRPENFSQKASTILSRLISLHDWRKCSQDSWSFWNIYFCPLCGIISSRDEFKFKIKLWILFCLFGFFTFFIGIFSCLKKPQYIINPLRQIIIFSCIGYRLYLLKNFMITL